MLRFFAGALLSFLITNWIYSEIVLIAPEVGPLSKRAMQIIKIPTHDEWNGISRSSGSSQMALDIDNLIAASPIGKAFQSIGLSSPRNFQVNYSKVKKQIPQAIKEAAPMLSGEDIFVSHAVNVVMPGGYTRFSL